MCGFAGILTRTDLRAERPVLAQMAQVISHRGPDDSGIETPIENLGLAFRRLAIIDLSENGHQPMYNADKSLCIVFNGEIYNAKELRETHVPDYPYRGYSDTEVILALYEKYGLDAIPRLNGMFAIALFDKKNKYVHLIRDRAGIKPLYYTKTENALVFGSEIKSLLQVPGVKRELNKTSVNEYFAFQFTLENRTLFNNIHSVEPATWMSYQTSNPLAPPQQTKYWDFEFDPESDRSIDSFSEELHTTIVDAIARQTRSDVKVGSFLSSGMDTGAIATLAKRLVPDLQTFTCGFDMSTVQDTNAFNDERMEARLLSKHLETRHHEIVIKPQDIQQLMEHVVWHLEDPKAGISYQIDETAKLVRKHAGVVLSGAGGDELFGGYHWRYSKIIDLNDHDTMTSSYYDIWNRILNDDERLRYFHPSFIPHSEVKSTREKFIDAFKPVSNLDPVSKALYFDSKYFLQGLLTVDDKLNMAHSVEARVPFLDNEVIQLALRMPSKFKFDGQNTKVALKHSLRSVLPKEVLQRRKQGFTPPDDHWFRHENRVWIESRLLSESFLDHQVFTREAIHEILENHFSGRRTSRFLIWSLLCLESVFRSFIDSTRLDKGLKCTEI